MLRLLLVFFFLHQTQSYEVRVKADLDIEDDTELGKVIREFVQKHLKDGAAEIDMSEIVQNLQRLISAEDPNLANHAKNAKPKRQKDKYPQSDHTKSEKNGVDHKNEETDGEIEHKLKKKHNSKNVSQDRERKNKKKQSSKLSKKNQSDESHYDIEKKSKKKQDSKKTKHSKIENINAKKVKHHRDSKDKKVAHHNKEKNGETEHNLKNYHPADSFSDDTEEKNNDVSIEKKHYSRKKHNKRENRDVKTSKQYDELSENFGKGGTHNNKSLKKSLKKYDNSKENEKGERDKVKTEINKDNDSEETKVHIFGKHEGAKVKDPLNKIKV